MSVTVNFQFSRNSVRPSGRHFLSITDGDSININQPIRMVSCDTPEKARYAGGVPISQPKLDICRDRLQNGFYDNIDQSLREYLLRKLTDDAASRHILASNRATEEFELLIEQRLGREDDSLRKLATFPTGEMIDKNGRLLAYVAPWYTGAASDPIPPRDDPRRHTFNLNMIENGWAAFFPIYPSIPSNNDMNLTIRAAELAWNEKRGAWDEFGDNVLLGYEYRLCIKLGTAENENDGIASAFQRTCVDLRNLNIVGPYGFHDIPPCYRLWVWNDQIDEATNNLDLNNDD